MAPAEKEPKEEMAFLTASLASASPGESQRFRTGASMQDFGGAKLALGIDKVKRLASAQVALLQLVAY
jgi:uncharacterized SAM-dependent methyltransferase